MPEKKELSNEELEKVTGGSQRINTAGVKEAYSDYNVPVGKYSGIANEKYLFVRTGSDEWLFGKLRCTYEDFWKRKRIHDIYVEDGYGTYGVIGNKTCLEVSDIGTIEVYGDIYQMYAKPASN